jgi:hypothetical protein
MKTMIAALVATTALIATLSHGMNENSGVARAEAGKPSDFILISGGTECRISQGAVREKIARLNLDPNCTGPSSPASQASMIEQKDDGTIDLLRQDGSAVVRFATAEGDTHISYEPLSPLIRLVAVD